MTRTPARTTTQATLGSVVDALGSGLIRLVTAPRGLDVPVCDVHVHDPVDAPRLGPGDVMLAVGVDADRPSAVDLIEQCGRQRATAVVLRTDDQLTSALITQADAGGVALLAAPREAAWAQLHTLLRSARSVSAPRGGEVSGTPLGDLFALADALANAVGGAVSIEDEHSTVLAHSTGSHPTDEARRASILGRQVPENWRDRLDELGVFRRLVTSDDIVRVEPLDDRATAARLAIGVRAGGEPLGSIWVQQGDRQFGPDAESALREGAALAALHLLRSRSGEDLDRRRSGDQLRAVLDGRLPAGLLAESLGTGRDARLVLLALQPAAAEAESGVPLDKLADFLTFTCRAFRRRVVAAAAGATVYALLPGPDGGQAAARTLAEELVGQCQAGLRSPVRAAVVDLPAGLRQLADGRQDVDLAVRVLSRRGETGPVHVADLQAAMVLLRLHDLADAHPELLKGHLAALAEADRERGSNYLPTLRAFLDAFGDVRLAAEIVGVHPNTFRYRLRRLCELTGLDLDDPRQRLVTHLQLHLSAP